MARLKAASAQATAAIQTLLADMVTAGPPRRQYGPQYYTTIAKDNSLTYGAVQTALIATLAELTAYVSFR